MYIFYVVTGQKPPDYKPPRIVEEIIAKYTVDANLFRQGSTNPKKEYPAFDFFLGSYTGGLLQRGFCPVGFYPGVFCREAFDLEPFYAYLSKDIHKRVLLSFD